MMETKLLYSPTVSAVRLTGIHQLPKNLIEENYRDKSAD